ncbi:MAG TPA: papain-like cysteine protease family protein [Anaerolineales bacterium]|nr:papain-like cysteine protease family protein [Anaerolineales bacterium]
MIVLDVPLVKQSNWDSCWYAATCMVAYFRYPGPRLGVPDIYAKSGDRGKPRPKNARGIIPGAELSRLAKNERFNAVPFPETGWTPDLLETALRKYGPIWAGGIFGNGQGHVIVLTGVIGDKVIFNDPWEPERKVQNFVWFNTNLGPPTWPSLMYLPA